MTAQPANEVIRIIFTEEDVRVENHNDNLEDGESPLDMDVAIARARCVFRTDEWASTSPTQPPSCIMIDTP